MRLVSHSTRLAFQSVLPASFPSRLLLLLLNALNAWVTGESRIDDAAQTCGILLFATRALRLVLLLRVSLVASTEKP